MSVRNPTLTTLLLSLAVPSSGALAASPLDVDFSREPSEDAYQTLTEPLLSPLRFAFIAPATATGLTGFDVGLAATTVKLPDSGREVFEKHIARGKDLPETLYLPRLVIQKGLPLGLDLAANALMVPGSKIRLLGAAVQYQLDLPVPALPLHAAARAGTSMLLGLPELESTQFTIEAVVSAGLPPGISALVNLEPYAGYGVDFASAESEIRTRVNGESQKRTFSHDWKESYILAGARFSLALFHLGGEAQFSTTGLPTVYSAKIGFGL
jgi:hypothetical protein